MNADGVVDNSDWFNKKPALFERHPLINLPYLIDGETIVTQSNSCLSYVGRKYNMYGSTFEENILCDTLLCEVFDLRNKVVGFAYSSKGSNKDDAVTFLESTNFNLNKLNVFKSKSLSDSYLVGNSATAPDFHLYEMIDQLKIIARVHDISDIIETSYPALSKFYSSFAALPQNQKYLSSSLAKLPMNNVMASLGSNPDGSKYSGGTECDWYGASGIY